VKVLDSVGDGFAYTRNGNFFVNNEGDLVLGMGDGYRLEPPINVPPNATDPTISGDGTVSVMRPARTRRPSSGSSRSRSSSTPTA
jgi:flagellar basal-body rod protein FlgG